MREYVQNLERRKKHLITYQNCCSPIGRRFLETSAHSREELYFLEWRRILCQKDDNWTAKVKSGEVGTDVWRGITKRTYIHIKPTPRTYIKFTSFATTTTTTPPVTSVPKFTYYYFWQVSLYLSCTITLRFTQKEVVPLHFCYSKLPLLSYLITYYPVFSCLMSY